MNLATRKAFVNTHAGFSKTLGGIKNSPETVDYQLSVFAHFYIREGFGVFEEEVRTTVGGGRVGGVAEVGACSR
ncbi:MAG: hypothetical protein HFJ93_06830, partial [Muribaculaceae bacterium]|nr:hypothetical protein [Muribaculaceae bacterium]